MPSVDPKTSFRFSYLILGFSIVAAISSHFYSIWAASQQEKALLPRPAVDQIVKALRSFHGQTGSFPRDFRELHARAWRNKQVGLIGEEGHSLTMANYYYIYSYVNPSACTLWAIPINKRREEGSTFFLALSPDTTRRWKGAPLAFQEIMRLPSVPEPTQLAILGLTEQTTMHVQPSRRRSNASMTGK